MAGDAEATRRRLLDAATREFAEYGIAGARVDRIAAAAQSNKAQIYHYFKNKDGLFDAVMTDLAREVVLEAPIDPTDLPEYAGRLFDRFANDQVKARLAHWYRLEGTDYAAVRAVAASTRDKIAAIAEVRRRRAATEAVQGVGVAGARRAPVHAVEFDDTRDGEHGGPHPA